MKLSNTQQKYMDIIKENGSIMVGGDAPHTIKILDSLVKKNLIKKLEYGEGWFRYRALDL